MATAKNVMAIVLALVGGFVGYCAMGANKVSDFFYSGGNARWTERGGLIALLLLCTGLILVFLRPAKGEAKKDEADASAGAPESEKPAE